MSVLLRPGDLIIDYSYARPSLAKARHDGATSSSIRSGKILRIER